MLNNDFELNEDNNSTYNVNHQKGEDKTDELKLENISAKGGENMKIETKIYGNCTDILRNTRHLIARLSDISIHIDNFMFDVSYLDYMDYNDEYALEDIHREYKIAINDLNQVSLDKLMDNYKLNMSKLKENFDLLEKIIQESKEDI